MSYSLVWLHNVLLNAGLKVAEGDGWENRGHGNIQRVRGVMCHHTGTPHSGNMPTLNYLTKGGWAEVKRVRKWVDGPLCNLGLGRDGTYYLVAAGLAYHAGKHSGQGWRGITNGNSHFIGIEAEHQGETHIVWPEIQMEAYYVGVAAILRHLGLNEMSCCGHKEYAEGRKSDPTFDMNDFRRRVAQLLATADLKFRQIPNEEPDQSPMATEKRPTLRRGMNNKYVTALQTRLNLPVNGEYDGTTEAAVRQFQRDSNLVPDGIVGPVTWRALL